MTDAEGLSLKMLRIFVIFFSICMLMEVSKDLVVGPDQGMALSGS